MRRLRARGQSTVEFAMVAIVLFGLLFAVIDLSRAGLMQHDLDMGASDLTNSLVTLANTNSDTSGNLDSFTATPLDPSAGYAAVAIPSALGHASAMSNNDIAASPPLTRTSSTRLSNGQITVIGTPNLDNPTEITVTVTAPFTPVVGFDLGIGTMRLTASTSGLTAASQANG